MGLGGGKSSHRRLDRWVHRRNQRGNGRDLLSRGGRNSGRDQALARRTALEKMPSDRETAERSNFQQPRNPARTSEAIPPRVESGAILGPEESSQLSVTPSAG